MKKVVYSIRKVRNSNEKLISTKKHGRSMVKTFAQTITFAPVTDSHDKKFSLLKSIEKYAVVLTLNPSKSDGKITAHCITFE